MARFSSDNFKINGPQHLIDNVTNVAIIKNPVKAESYAATLAKAVATTTFVGGDVTTTPQGNGDVHVIMAAKAGIDPSASALISDDLSAVYYNSAGTEIILSMEITDKAIANDDGDTLNIPETTHIIRENSAV